MVPFSTVSALAEAEGLTALAVLIPPARLDAAGLDRMVADGLGDLGWIAEQRAMRSDPRSMRPDARALVVVAWDYQREGHDGDLRRARYAAGKDYHVILRPKLARLGKALGGGQRACVDSAPINERTLARLAGLGWIGRNALLIHPRRGSYRLLGALLTTVDLEAHRGDGADHGGCGSCQRCETACPTAALVDGRVLTTRCISYLTIEHKGVIPRELALRFAGWWFGCDVCQEVCPWNRFAPGAADPRLAGHEDDGRLLAVQAADFDAVFAGRAIRRIGYERFRRNLLVALASLGREAECAPLIAEGLPLVLDQARELQLIPAGHHPAPCISPSTASAVNCPTAPPSAAC